MTLSALTSHIAFSLYDTSELAVYNFEERHSHGSEELNFSHSRGYEERHFSHSHGYKNGISHFPMAMNNSISHIHCKDILHKLLIILFHIKLSNHVTAMSFLK